MRRRNWNFGLLSHPLRQRERAGAGAGHSEPSVTLPDSSAVFPASSPTSLTPTPEPAAQPDDPQPKKDAETACTGAAGEKKQGVAARRAAHSQSPDGKAETSAFQLQSAAFSVMMDLHGIPCGSLPENGRRLALPQAEGSSSINRERNSLGNSHKTYFRPPKGGFPCT